MSRRPGHEGRNRSSGPPRSDYHHAKWHDWWVCRTCGAVVEDWEVHDEWHEGQPGQRPADAYELERAARGRDGQAEEGESMEELRDRANREGRSVVQPERERADHAMFGAETWRQIRGVFRLRPPKEA